MRLQTTHIALALAVAALSAPAALAENRSPDTIDAAFAAHAQVTAVVPDGRSPDTRDAAFGAHRLSTAVVPDGRSPDTIDAALVAQQSSSSPLDGRSPDTKNAAEAAQAGVTSIDLRSPDTRDAALLAHSPVVTIVRSGGFDWGDAGIGAGTAFGLMLLGIGSGLVVLRRRAQDTGGRPAATSAS